MSDGLLARRRRASPRTRWTIAAAGRHFVIETCSARTAIDRASEAAGARGTVVGIELGGLPSPPTSATPTRHVRRRRHLLPDAVRRRAAGETIAEIARSLGVSRETLRDWLRDFESSP